MSSKRLREKSFRRATTLIASFSRLRFHLLGLRKFQDKLDIPSVRDRTTMAGIRTRDNLIIKRRERCWNLYNPFGYTVSLG